MESREVLPEVLANAGAKVTVVPVYRTVKAHARKEELVQALEEDRIDCITFASSSTVRNFMESIPQDVLKKAGRVRFASIGPITTKTLEEFGFKADIEPKDYTIPALLADITVYFQRKRTCSHPITNRF